MEEQFPKLVVLISGSGSNLQALIDAISVGDLPAEITAVVSNKASAYGLIRAKNMAIQTLTFPYAPFKGQGRAAYDEALAQQVARFQPDLVILAGWMRILTDSFLQTFPNRVLNLHPALPNSYIGAHGIDWAWEAWERGEIEETGCMVHIATTELDRGPVIESAVVPFIRHEPRAEFEARLHQVEHRLIVAAVKEVLAEMSRP